MFAALKRERGRRAGKGEKETEAGKNFPVALKSL